MDFNNITKNNTKQILQKKKIKVNEDPKVAEQTKVNDKMQTKVNDKLEIELEKEKEKTRQLELIREIKKLELKLSNKKKYKHTKKYLDLSSILNDSDEDEIDNREINDHYAKCHTYNTYNTDDAYDAYDTISIQSTKSITTIEYQ